MTCKIFVQNINKNSYLYKLRRLLQNELLQTLKYIYEIYEIKTAGIISLQVWKSIPAKDTSYEMLKENV
jgi:hypothetical protein